MADTAATDVQVAYVPEMPKLTGRIQIFTDLSTKELETEKTMREELERVLDIHWVNVLAIRFLQNYYKGIHPAIRDRRKKVRPDVDNKIVVNYAYSATRDITGYFLGKSVRYVHRGSVKQSEAEAGTEASSGKRTQVERLNHIFDIENKAKVDWDIALNMSINGVGYRGIFSEENPRNGTHISVNSLNPETTFVVYSSGNMNIPMFAVSYWTNNVSATEAKKTFVRVYTQTKQYDYTVDGDMVANGPLASSNGFTHTGTTDISFNGSLPIIEYCNNAYRMGDWEVAIPLMDGIDTLASDGVNDIEQFVQSVLVAIGIEFDETTEDTLNRVGVLNVAQLPPGMDYAPVIQYISPQLDPQSGINMREYLESSLRVVIGVPDRKTRGGGGGDTGDAVYLRDGWQDIDLVAANKENSFIQAEREALNIALFILKQNDELTDEIEPSDVEIKFNRNKTSNIQSKAQVLQILWSMLDPSDALDICDLTTNVEDVIIRAEQYQQKRLQNQLREQEEVSKVAAKFDDGNAANANTGSQPKTKNNSDEGKQ